MRNLDSCRWWRCTLCPCKVRNEFLVNFWNRTILLCILCTFVIISRIILLGMRNVSDKLVESIKTHILCSKTFFFPQKSCRLWDDMGKYGKPTEATDGNITRRMRFSCCIPKATNTHLEYVILCAFAQQRWLSENPSTSRHTCIACFFLM